MSFYKYSDICLYATLTFSNQTTFVKVFDSHVEEECIISEERSLLNCPSFIFIDNEQKSNITKHPRPVWKPPVNS